MVPRDRNPIPMPCALVVKTVERLPSAYQAECRTSIFTCDWANLVVTRSPDCNLGVWMLGMSDITVDGVDNQVQYALAEVEFERPLIGNGEGLMALRKSTCCATALGRTENQWAPPHNFVEVDMLRFQTALFSVNSRRCE